MATSDVQTGSEPSLTGLVSGIVGDAQELIKQQMTLVRHEIQSDLRKTRQAATPMLFGAGVAMLGGLLLCFMLVMMLYELAHVPMWGSFAIVGGVFAVLGVILLYVGKVKFDSFNPLPDESFQALKENLQWTQNPK